MRDIPKRLGKAGFTLIEILIALSIFSIMAVMSSTVLYTTFNARDKTTEHAIRLSKLQVAMVLIERDFSQIVNQPISVASISQAGVVGLSEEIKFSRGGVINPLFEEKRSTIGRVKYFLDNNKLIRSSSVAINRAKQLTSQTEVLLSNVLELKFEYINKNGLVQQQWYNKELPKAIRISLQLDDWGKISQIYVLSQSKIYVKKIANE